MIFDKVLSSHFTFFWVANYIVGVDVKHASGHGWSIEYLCHNIFLKFEAMKWKLLKIE